MKKFKLSWGWFGIGLIVLSLLLHLYIALSPANSVMHWYTSDDAFFYFKVAANITSGHGATFDGINHTNGFHPLWMLICIPVFILARFNLILPLRILVLISALLNAGTGYLLFSLLRKFISNITAAAVAVIWVFLPTIQGGVTWGGMETAVNAFCLMLLLTLAVRWRGESIGIWKMLALGCAAGLAVLARLDNVFVVLLLGVWFVFGSASGYLRTIVVGDLALVFLSGMLSYFIRLRTGPFYQRFSVSLPALIGLGFVIKPLMLFLFKLYPPLRERLSMKMIARTLLAISLSALIIGGSLLLLKGVGIFKDLPRSVIIIDWVGTLLGVLGLRFFAWLISSGESPTGKSPFGPSWKIFVQRILGYYVPVGFMLGGFITWSYLYTGEFMPLSGQIKHWWGMLADTVYGTVVHGIPELMGVSGHFNAWGLVAFPVQSITNLVKGWGGSKSLLTGVNLGTILLVTIIVALLVYSQRKWIAGLLDKLGLLALLFGLYAQIINYTSTSYINIRSWYWIGEMLFTMLGLGILLECLHRFLQGLRSKPWVWQGLMAALMAAVIVSYGGQVAYYFPYRIPPKGQEAYLTGIKAIEAHTEPGAVIGSTGGGRIGYFIKDRTVVNMDGLINSTEYFQALQKGQGAAFLDRMGMDYVFGNKYVLTATDPYQRMLDARLGQEVVTSEGLVLFRYLPAH